jgi:ubiquinone/menaquinone biosynthesis C-methylase UbiE
MQTKQLVGTKNVYQNPQVVREYVKRNATKLKMAKYIKNFSQYFSSRDKILDLGCGPGQDSYQLQQLKLDVIGIDFSEEMIKQAKNLKKVNNPPKFIVGDITELNKFFDEESFDGIWASASLVHFKKKNIPQVINQIDLVTKKQGIIFIGLKGGPQGEITIKETKYGVPTKRDFTLWKKEDFIKIIQDNANWELISYQERDGSIFMGKPTTWQNYIFKKL